MATAPDTAGWTMRAASQADYDQFLELVDLHGASVLALLRRLAGSASDADDLFQETAIRVWRSFANRPALRDPRAWLMTIAYRTFLDQRSRQKRHGELMDLADESAESPDLVAERIEASARLNRAVDGLDEPIREVILLHYIGGMSLRETADVMQLSVGTVKSRLNTALGKLRSWLE